MKSCTNYTFRRGELTVLFNLIDDFVTNEDLNSEGGDGEVEIDESLFGKKRKYNRGSPSPQSWVFGIASKDRKRCHIEVVPNRTKVTLNAIIEAHISKSCTISHDDWSSYRTLNKSGYSHKVVNHSETFVTEDGVHTNTIEGLWGLIKLRIRSQKGVRGYLLTPFLHEFMFRYNFCNKMIIPESKIKHIICEL